MKLKVLFLMSFVLNSLLSFSYGSERIEVYHNQQFKPQQDVDFIDPCVGMHLKAANLNYPPVDYVGVGKLEWYVDGDLKKTADGTDIYYDYTPTHQGYQIVLKVYYKKDNGTLSSAYTTPSFTITISEPYGFQITQPTIAYYGCTDAISFTGDGTTCSQYCAGSHNLTLNSTYTITWTAPSGWTQTSISPGHGNTVTYTPSATTDGPLTATINYSCGYTWQKTITIDRPKRTPTWSALNFTGCSSTTASLSAAVCGATSYTYTIVGPSSLTFTANSSQSLTTIATSAAISLSGGGDIGVIKVKANYTGGVSSSEVSADIVLGAPTPQNLSFPLIDPTFWKIQAMVDPIPGVTYSWYRNGTQITYPPTSTHFIQFAIPHVCDVEYDISVRTNACSTQSDAAHALAYVPCESFMIIAPNPASDEVTVSMDAVKTSASMEGIDQVKLYDLQGNLKKVWKFGKMKSARIHVGMFPSGNYYLEIIAGKTSERKMLLIKK